MGIWAVDFLGHRGAIRGGVLALAMALSAPAQATLAAQPGLDPAIFGMPAGDWPFVRPGPKGPEIYRIPSQLDAIRRLPEPERSASLQAIRQHQANLSFFQKTSARFFARLGREKLQTIPEYAMDLGEAVMAVDYELAQDANPLFAHEPVLKALPAYTRVKLLAPAEAISRVRQRLHTLGLADRVQVVQSRSTPSHGREDGTTRWMRDAILAARDDRGAVMMMPLAYKDFADVAHNDLDYMKHIGDARHRLVRLPLFFRGGNVAVAEAGRKLLLIGSDEMEMNRRLFVDTFGFSPPPQAISATLKAATGVDEVVVLPNSRNFYHLDTFIAPLAEATIGLLSPLDPERLAAADRNVLARAGEVLMRLGFRVVPIPTRSEWIRNFESPTNIVSFSDRSTGGHRALVPQFPEPAGQAPGQSLNARVLAAYRGAGIDPIAVEDRFHTRWGNTHCALVALH